jgi:hypothetical protein
MCLDCWVKYKHGDKGGSSWNRSAARWFLALVYDISRGYPALTLTMSPSTQLCSFICMCRQVAAMLHHHASPKTLRQGEPHHQEAGRQVCGTAVEMSSYMTACYGNVYVADDIQQRTSLATTSTHVRSTLHSNTPPLHPPPSGSLSYLHRSTGAHCRCGQAWRGWSDPEWTTQ